MLPWVHTQISNALHARSPPKVTLPDCENGEQRLFEDGADILWRHRRLVAAALLPPVAYLSAADALAIVVGSQLGARLPERAIKIGAAVSFFVFGAILIVEGLLPLRSREVREAQVVWLVNLLRENERHANGTKLVLVSPATSETTAALAVCSSSTRSASSLRFSNARRCTSRTAMASSARCRATISARSAPG